MKQKTPSNLKQTRPETAISQADSSGGRVAGQDDDNFRDLELGEILLAVAQSRDMCN